MRAIVVGAGPGGACAALALARAGASVHLIEKSAWPRAKTCGDGVSPLAVREARELGADFAPNLELRRALVTTPMGIAFRGGWPAATPWGTIVERRSFDAALVDGAIARGAAFFPETAVRALAVDGDEVVATLESHGAERTVRADVAIVAEGATGNLAAKLGFPAFRSRLVAIRGYARSRGPLAAEYGLYYDRSVSPGYGWIFPVDERRANVGICLDERKLARGGGDLRALLGRWLRENRYARELLEQPVELDDVRGGIIPSGRRRRANGRILLVGDAAGVADPFTAEGIAEAMHSGRIAAEALTGTSTVGAAAERYERMLRVFDRNEAAARGLRATFAAAIEPYAAYATLRPAFADRLMTGVFFLKQGFPQMLLGLHLGRGNEVRPIGNG
jgi:geranylgeranyl reductase family protein